jgi:alcohol dehydrogenase class IV
MRTFWFPSIGSVVSGAGSVAALPDYVKEAGASRVLLVVSKTLNDTPAGERVRGVLGDSLVATFAGTPQHVPASALLDLIEVARKHQIDAVVSFGGGTQVDAAKAVAMALAADVKSAEDLERCRARQSDDGRVLMPADPGPMIPVFCIATALSAAEHTDMTGVVDDETLTKHVYRFAALAPRAVILDAELTKYTPADLWASSGVRALDHAIESMLSVSSMPFRDALGAKTIELLRANLLASTENPDDLDARGACLEAAWLSSFGILATGAGLSHAIGHQLAPQFEVMHGVSSAIMLPVVMEFNALVTREQLDRVAAAIRTPEDDPSMDAPELVRRFIATLPIPHSISAVGGSRDVFATMAAEIVKDPTFPLTPQPVSESDIVSLLEAAYED